MNPTPDENKIIKNFFPELNAKHRKLIIKQIKITALNKNITFQEAAEIYKKAHEERREKDLPKVLMHVINTALLVESNDMLKGTYFDGYYNKITGNNGKAFMNAQNALYLKEFDQLATTHNKNINDLLTLKEISIKCLAHSFDEDFPELVELLKTWLENPNSRKRFSGIVKSEKNKL